MKFISQIYLFSYFFYSLSGYRTLGDPEYGWVSPEEIETLCKTAHPQTREYVFHQTMVRIKDPRKSILHWSDGCWGTDFDLEGYHNGNDDPREFGHIGIRVPDVDAASARLEEQNVEFAKRLKEGSNHGVAFIQDPDGYWIEVFQADRV